VTDSLKKGLEHRPQKEDLIERSFLHPPFPTSTPQHYTTPKTNILLIGNILPTSNAAPSIQAHARELEKHMRADSLNEKIAHRPNPQELVKEGILQEDPTSPEKETTQAANDKLYEERIEEEYA
jgi:hypothetical protein